MPKDRFSGLTYSVQPGVSFICNLTIPRSVLESGISSCKATITLVFFTFLYLPYSCLPCLMLSISSCSPFTLLAIIALSSANLSELTKQPQTFTSFSSSIVVSSYRLKSNGDSVHPCLTPAIYTILRF